MENSDGDAYVSKMIRSYVRTSGYLFVELLKTGLWRIRSGFYQMLKASFFALSVHIHQPLRERCIKKREMGSSLPGSNDHLIIILRSQVLQEEEGSNLAKVLSTISTRFSGEGLTSLMTFEALTVLEVIIKGFAC